MVRLYLVLLIFFLQNTVIRGQTLIPNPENLNLGKLGRGWSGEALWTISNPTSNPVQILEVRSGCNCVESKADKTLLGPGESTKIRANIRTLSQAGGKSSWRVTLKFAPPGKTQDEPETLSLMASAEFVADLRIEPTIISFKGSGPGQSKLQILDDRSPPIRILKTSSNLSAISTHWSESSTPSNQSLLILKKPGPAARGFVVLETDDPSRPRIEIPIQIEDSLTSSVEVTPSRIQWNSTGTCRMVLSRPGDLLVRVDKVEVPPEVTVKILRGPGPRTTLEFRNNGNLPAGSKAMVIFEKKELGKLVLDLD